MAAVGAAVDTFARSGPTDLSQQVHFVLREGIATDASNRNR